MAFLTKRKSSGKWYIRWYENGQVHNLSTKEKSKVNADIVFDQWKRNRSGFTLKTLRLSNLQSEVLRFASVNVANATLRLWKDTFNGFISLIGNKPLERITTQDVEYYKKVRIQRLKKVSLNIEIRVLKRFFNLAAEFNLLEHNKIKFKQFAIPEQKPLAFSQYEKELIIDKIKNPEIKDIVIFAFNTGCRLNEIVNLQLKDVNFHEREINICNKPNFKTKTGKVRTIPMNNTLYEMLARRRKTDGNIINLATDNNYVFSYKGSFISHSFKRVLRRLNFDERYKFHCTRHTFATNLADKNTPVHILQSLMGHSDSSSTMVYLHANKEEQRKAISKL